MGKNQLSCRRHLLLLSRPIHRLVHRRLIQPMHRLLLLPLRPLLCPLLRPLLCPLPSLSMTTVKASPSANGTQETASAAGSSAVSDSVATMVTGTTHAQIVATLSWHQLASQQNLLPVVAAMAATGNRCLRT